MSFRALNFQVLDKQSKLLEYNEFLWLKVLIFQDLRINSADDEIGERARWQFFA